MGAALMPLTFRTLPPEEWNRLIADGIEPYATYGLPPDPQHWVLVVAEQDGHIVGCSSLVETVQNHWFTQDTARRDPSVLLGLWKATKAVLDDAQVPVLHTTVSNTQPDVQHFLEESLGCRPADGRLYLLSVADCPLNERI